MGEAEVARETELDFGPAAAAQPGEARARAAAISSLVGMVVGGRIGLMVWLID